MVFVLQLFIYLMCFTACIKLLVLNDPVRGIFFYPKPVQRRAFEMGLATEREAKRRKIIFFTVIARDTYERNSTFRQLLTGLGVDEKTAAADACEMEHVVSRESYKALKRLL